MKSILFLTFILLATENKALGQTGIKGRIIDNQNQEIPYATVFVEAQQKGTTSNTDGNFEITLKNGTYELKISSVGFVTRKIDVTINDKLEDLGNIRLDFANQIVDEVVVSASKNPEKITESPATINLITSTQLEKFAGSPEELFALQKGQDFTRKGNFWSSISIRGFNSAFNQKILVLDDNRIANLRIRTPVGPFSAFVKEDIERVEIVLGPSSALYGPNSLNALFNTISKSPFTYPGTTIVVGTGSYNLLNARFRHANAINKKWAYKITSEYLTGKEPDFTDSVYVPLVYAGRPEIGLEKDVTFFKLLTAAFYKPTERSEIGVNYSLNLSTSMDNARNNLKNWNNSALQFTYKSRHWFGQFYKTWIILGQALASRSRALNYYGLLALGQSEEEAFENSLNGPRRTITEEDSYRHNAEIQYNNNWKNLNLVVGTQYQKEHAFSNHTFLIDDIGPIILYQYGVYGQVIYDLNETGLKFIFASRADYHNLFGFNYLPKAGITYTKNNGTWRLTYGKGYLVPTLINTYQNFAGGTILGNAEGFTLSDFSKIAPLKPETIKTLEAGYKNIFFNRKLFLDTDVYYNWSENMISPIINIVPNGTKDGPVVTHRGDRPITDFTQGPKPGSTIYTNVNFGWVQTYGFDVGINYYFSDHYNITLNYSYFDYYFDKNDLRNEADGKVTDNDLSINTPKNKISSAINVIYRKFYGTLYARWIQKYDFFSGRNIAAKTNPDNLYNVWPVIENKRVFDSFNYGPLGGFYLSANANYQFTKILNMGLYANNLLGKGNHEFVATAPVETTFGVELKLTIF